MRTPRDSFRLNQEDGSMQLVGQTPRDIRIREQAAKSSLQAKLASLPKPQQMEFELEALPDEQDEFAAAAETTEEDAAARDKRNAEIAHAAALAEFRLQTKVVQKGLPRPKVIDVNAMLKAAKKLEDPCQRMVAEEVALLMANDATKFGGAKITGTARPVQQFGEVAMQNAQMEIVLEMGQSADRANFGSAFEAEWQAAHANSILPGLAGYAEDELDEEKLLVESFDTINDTIMACSERGAAVEKRLGKVQGGYLARQRVLRSKISQAAEVLERTKLETEVARAKVLGEEIGLAERLERLRDEVALVSRREREAQGSFRERREELEALVG